MSCINTNELCYIVNPLKMTSESILFIFFLSRWGWDGLSGQWETTTLPAVLVLCQRSGMNCPSQWHHHSWSLRPSLWAQRDPQLWTNPEQPWLEGFLPFSSSSLSVFHLSSVLLLSLSLFFLILPNPCLEKTFRRNYGLILHCNPRWSELWCDQLLCNDPLMMGAPPVACCALTCVGPAKL